MNEIGALFNDIALALEAIADAEQKLEQRHGIKVSHVSLLGRKMSKDNWSIFLNAGIDRAADSVNRPAIERTLGYSDRRLKAIAYKGVEIIQYAECEQTPIYR